MFLHTEEIQLTRKKIASIANDAERTAATINLRYVSDSSKGITRVKRGKKFIYYYKGKAVRDKETLERIKKLVIPPAWQNVWICCDPNGHLQATGYDAKHRKQYKYHHLWNHLRNHTKFYRLQDFGKVIPGIRKRIERDLALRGLPLSKVLALIVCLMERTSIRIGNGLYEKLYGSFGLCTLKDRHVKVQKDSIRFAFKGKKGVMHNISIKNKKLANIVKMCRNIPGQELFQYIDNRGNYRCVDSGMVNDYIREISGKDFSAKDFRTWAGTVQALAAFKNVDCPQTQTGKKRNIVIVLDYVAKHLGNTRSVCKKYYIHPMVISLYEKGKLHRYLNTLPVEGAKVKQLDPEEQILMQILEKERYLAAG